MLSLIKLETKKYIELYPYVTNCEHFANHLIVSKKVIFNCNSINLKNINIIKDLVELYKIIKIKIDISSWFEHMFILFLYKDEIYIVHSYIFNYTPCIQKFNWNNFKKFLLKIPNFNIYPTSDEKIFLYMSMLWNNFWNVKNTTSIIIPLNTFNIYVFN